MEDIVKKLGWLKLQGEMWARMQDDEWETYRRNMQEIWGEGEAQKLWKLRVEFAKVEREDSLSAFRTSLRERNMAYLRERHATRLAQLMQIDEKYTWGPSEKLKGIWERARVFWKKWEVEGLQILPEIERRREEGDRSWVLQAWPGIQEWMEERRGAVHARRQQQQQRNIEGNVYYENGEEVEFSRPIGQ